MRPLFWRFLNVHNDKIAAGAFGNDVRGCEVTLKAERAAEDPKVFTRITFHFTVRGRQLRPEVVQRAVRLSHDKYCSASVMLAKTAELTHTVEIIEE